MTKTGYGQYNTGLKTGKKKSVKITQGVKNKNLVGNSLLKAPDSCSTG
jgi:hypothetical protein